LTKEKCEKQLVPIHHNQITHSSNEWVTIDVMEDYFVFLHNSIEIKEQVSKSQRILLVLNMYPSHCEEELGEKEEVQRFELLFIPLGMTDCLQPLDAKNFDS
jgi:hypothetical protein